jgi:hypothetical protein
MFVLIVLLSYKDGGINRTGYEWQSRQKVSEDDDTVVLSITYVCLVVVRRLPGQCLVCSIPPLYTSVHLCNLSYYACES